MSVTHTSIDVASSIWIKVASLMPIVATVDNNIVMIAYLKSYCVSAINTEGLIIYNNHQALVISTLILQPILVKTTEVFRLITSACSSKRNNYGSAKGKATLIAIVCTGSRSKSY